MLELDEPNRLEVPVHRVNHVGHGEAFHAHTGRVGDSVRDLDVKLRLNRVAVLLGGVQDNILVVVPFGHLL